ncbi:glutathione S-transferase [Gluconacetobacter liquefaciens]|uniref:glutathione transferase n=1 Tax=Gluconacetobacter liquefaciens TaxID=89584 RepID=A0A370G2X2_GLULI|nr:glutathione S-transferase [Gluconacetobacter liquefaciens]MBB2186549.1 glutathione S-transferase [Gluconacetobacter liquefaciens]RDI38217.1 glutathione S-transferase [Gluconacetobacter liquefaciens]GBQ98398.1 glutathione S-transferase [Gluconacetobacter liquefaciens NRIC 0522]GEB36728.1 glutathione S-transferase [Gluconacetobacter liquefaciens]
MIIVHHLENSRSQRVLWLLEELGVPYEIRFYKRDPRTMQAPPELRKIHPLGKSPIITEGDVTLAESGAILEYLLDEYDQGHLRPPVGTPEYRSFIYWLHYAEGSAMPPLVMKLIFGMLPSRVPFLLRPFASLIAKGVQTHLLDPEIKRHTTFWEDSLTQTGWFAGDAFSAADIQMSFPLEAASTRTGAVRHLPHVGAFLRRIHARPAWRRALERGGPYAYSGV